MSKVSAPLVEVHDYSGVAENMVVAKFWCAVICAIAMCRLLDRKMPGACRFVKQCELADVVVRGGGRCCSQQSTCDYTLKVSSALHAVGVLKNVSEEEREFMITPDNIEEKRQLVMTQITAGFAVPIKLDLGEINHAMNLIAFKDDDVEFEVFYHDPAMGAGKLSVKWLDLLTNFEGTGGRMTHVYGPIAPA